MSDGVDRRSFLKKTALASASLGAMSSIAAAQDPDQKGSAGKKDEPPKAAKKVPRRQLGNTGQTIPILLFGGSMTFDPKYDKMLHRGFKEGVDYIDTALVYARGQSHKTIAPFVKQVGREKVWLTSKAPHRNNRADVASFEKDFSTCLEQLGVKHLDLFFMHMLNDPKYLDKEYIQMGDRLKKASKTKFFGFSCHDGNVVDLMNKAAKIGGIDAIMFRYSFGQYGDKALNRAIDACKKAKIRARFSSEWEYRKMSCRSCPAASSGGPGRRAAIRSSGIAQHVCLHHRGPARRRWAARL